MKTRILSVAQISNLLYRRFPTCSTLLLAAFATALFIGTTVFLTQRPDPIESPAPTEEAEPLPAQSAENPNLNRNLTLNPPFQAAETGQAVDLPEVPQPPLTTLQVPADLVLAKVNATDIPLKHLVPLEAHETERMMTPEEFYSRLNRAIEMELTFQAAAAQGIGFTPEQSRRLNDIAPKHDATFQEYAKQGITWSSLTAEQLQSEQRLTAALMLQQNLVAREAGFAPSSDAGVQLRYEQALQEILSRLKAHASIIVTTAEL